jgi:hypothetical protein
MVGVHTDHDPTQRSDPIQTKDHAHVCCLDADDNKTDQKYTFQHMYSNIQKLNVMEQGRKSMLQGRMFILVYDNAGPHVRNENREFTLV